MTDDLRQGSVNPNPFDRLGVRRDVRAAYKVLAQARHPDKGGTVEAFQQLARDLELAMKTAPTARACADCRGSGRREKSRGFFRVTLTCATCGGSGEERPA